MAFEIRRPKDKLPVMVLNTAMVTGAGCWIIYDALKTAAPSWFSLALGGLMLVWAAWIAYNLARGLVLRLDEAGIVARGLVGTHRFGWDALLWVDFTRPQGAALLTYAGQNGKEALVVLTRKGASDAERAEALRIIQDRRPDLPLASPTPLVTLRGTP
jgi:Bacterial PH domain